MPADRKPPKPPRKPRSETQVARKLTALRIGEDELDEIKQRAEAAGMSVSEYMRKAALGKLDETKSGVQERFEAVEERLNHLEEFAFGRTSG